MISRQMGSIVIHRWLFSENLALQLFLDDNSIHQLLEGGNLVYQPIIGENLEF